METVIYDKSWFDDEKVIATLLSNQPSEKHNFDRTSDSSSYQDFICMLYDESKFSNCNDIIYIDNTNLTRPELFESPYFNIVDLLQIECMFFLGTGTPQQELEVYDPVIQQELPNINHITDINYVKEEHTIQLYDEPIETVRNSYPPEIIYSDTEDKLIIDPSDIRDRYTTVTDNIVLNTDQDPNNIVSQTVSNVKIYNKITKSYYSLTTHAKDTLSYMVSGDIDNITDGVLSVQITSNHNLVYILDDLQILYLVGENQLQIEFDYVCDDKNGVNTNSTIISDIDDLLFIHPNPETVLNISGLIIFQDKDYLPNSNGTPINYYNPQISHEVNNVQYIDRITGDMLPMDDDQYSLLLDIFKTEYDPIEDVNELGERTITWKIVCTQSKIDKLNITMNQRMTVQYSVKIEDEKGAYTYEIITIYILPNYLGFPITTNLSIIYDGSSTMSQDDLDVLKNAIVLIQRKYHKIGVVNLNVISCMDDNHTSESSTWNTPIDSIDMEHSTSLTNLQSGMDLLINSALDGSEPSADRNVVYFFISNNSDNSPVNYHSRLYNFLSEWYEFIKSKIDELYTYSINSSTTLDDAIAISNVDDLEQSKSIVNIPAITKIDDIKPYILFSTIWTKDIDYVFIDKYKIHKFPSEDKLYNSRLDDIKVSIYYSKKWYYETTRSRSRNLENLYGAVEGITVDLLNISDDLDESILYSDLNIICLPDDEFTDDEIEYMRRALIKGNRIFFIGEHGADQFVVNGIINSAILKLGGDLEITNNEYFDNLSKLVRTDDDPVGFGWNINKHPINSGVKFLNIEYFNQLKINRTNSLPIVVDDSDRIMIAEQSVLNGRITVIANSHMDLEYGNAPYDNTTFMVNMAIDSWIRTQYVKDHIYLNDYTLNPYDDIFKGQFIQVNKIGQSDTTNIKMYNYFSTKQNFNMLYTDTYELFFNTTVYPFISEIYFNKIDKIGDYNLFKYMKDHGSSINAFNTWLYTKSPWKGINRDCSIKNQKMRVHTYINVIESLVLQ